MSEVTPPCPRCRSSHTWVSYEDCTAFYCGACRRYWRPEP